MSRGTSADPFRILLVEDNPGDADLIVEALGEAPFPHVVTTARDGVEAMEFLRREGAHAGAPLPDLVLLDLNLPRKDGREVLAEVKGDPDLVQIPVLVLTSSEAERDLLQAYRLHANSFVSKPVELGQYFEVIRAIEQFWLAVAKLPPRVDDEAAGAPTRIAAPQGPSDSRGSVAVSSPDRVR